VAAHVFISYSRVHDNAYAERLAVFLAGEGIPVWFDRHLVGGTRWANIIAEKIDSCAALIVVMSPGAEQSKWVSREIGRAEERNKTIVPVLRAGQPFFRVSDLQYVDATEGQLPGPVVLDQLRALVAASSGPDPARRDPDGRPPVAGPGAPAELPAVVRGRGRRALLVVGLLVALTAGLVTAGRIVGWPFPFDRPPDNSATVALTAALGMLKTQSYNVTTSNVNGQASSHGSIDPPHHRFTLEISTAFEGQSIHLGGTEIGSQLWVRINVGNLNFGGIDPTKWMPIDRAKLNQALQFEFYQPDVFDFAGLLGEVSNVTRTDASHIDGTVDLTAATGISRPDQVTLATAGAVAKTTPFTVTLDDQGRMTALDITGSGQGIGLTEDVAFSSYGSVGLISAPAAADIVAPPPGVYDLLNNNV
jgi:hypothetical protein